MLPSLLFFLDYCKSLYFTLRGIRGIKGNQIYISIFFFLSWSLSRSYSLSLLHTLSHTLSLPSCFLISACHAWCRFSVSPVSEIHFFNTFLRTTHSSKVKPEWLRLQHNWWLRLGIRLYLRIVRYHFYVGRVRPDGVRVRTFERLSEPTSQWASCKNIWLLDIFL